MPKLNIGLNGFGRIGRALTRIAFTKNLFNIVAVNTAKTPPEMNAYLLKYDSVYRTFGKDVQAQKDAITVDGMSIACFNFRDPEEIPWDKYNVDIVIDATGVFKKRDDLKKHIKGSVKKVILTAPTADETIPHIVLGVNSYEFDFQSSDIISNASCTTNCAAVMFKVLNDNFKITSGFLTTAHAYTSSQQLLDNSSKEFARSRAAALSIIPSTTGAAKAVAKVIPDLSGKIDGMSLRIPAPVGSITDISAIVEKQTNSEAVNNIFKNAAENMKGILSYEETPLVSSDYIGSSYSCILDANYTKVISGNLIKIFGWYDNEWGYSSRLSDLVSKIAELYA